MSRIDDLIAELCPNGVPRVPMGEVGHFIRGNGLQKSDLLEEGVPAIHYGQIHTHYGIWAAQTKSFVDRTFALRLRKAQPGDLVIVTTSEDDAAVGKAVAWVGDEPAAVSGDTWVYRHSLEPKFVAYFFQTEDFQKQKQLSITGTKVRRISGEALGKISIPLPPLEVQQGIVRILDTFTELESELESELEARRQQYTYYRDSLLSFGDEVLRVSLGDISTRVSSGGTPLVGQSEYYDNGTIPWLRTQEIRFVDIWDTQMRITEKAVKETSANWIPPNCVIIAISGATAGRSAVNKIPMTTNQHCCNFEIDPTRANYMYVFYWVRSQYEQIRALGQGARSDLNSGIIKKVKIPLPPLEVQQEIVTILNKFDALVNDLSIGLPAELAARRKQYEFYRDKLLTFKEKTA